MFYLPLTQNGVEGGFESTKQRNDTEAPWRRGDPQAGHRRNRKSGGSEINSYIISLLFLLVISQRVN